MREWPLLPMAVRKVMSAPGGRPEAMGHCSEGCCRPHNTGICGAMDKPARSLKSPNLLRATDTSCRRRRNNGPRKRSPWPAGPAFGGRDP